LISCDDFFFIPEECELRGMTPERIYLLARMGNTRAALGLIIRELADIEQAVAFCKGDQLYNYKLPVPLFLPMVSESVWQCGSECA